MRKYLRQIRDGIQSRYAVEVELSHYQSNKHPCLLARSGGVEVLFTVPSTPSDKRRNAMNIEREMKRAFMDAGHTVKRRKN